jgi:hypothetical protein
MIKVINSIQLLMGALFVYVFLTVCTTKVYIAGVNSGCAAGSWELILCTPAALYYIYLCFKFFGKNQGQEQIGAVGALILILVLIDGILIWLNLTNSTWSKDSSAVSSMGMSVEAIATKEFKQLMICSFVLFGLGFIPTRLMNKS